MDCPICKTCNTTQEDINTCAAKMADVIYYQDAEIARWEAAYTKVFEALEAAQARIEYLAAQLAEQKPCRLETDETESED